MKKTIATKKKLQATHRLQAMAFLAAVLGCLHAPSANANLILNGSFEGPNIAPNTSSFATPDDWIGGYNIFTAGVGGAPAPQHGAQYENIGYGVYLELSQTFNLVNAGSYLLTWYDSSGNDGNTYDVLINGVSFNSYTDPLTTDVWNFRQEILSLAAGDNTLTFRGTSLFKDTYLDNVSLTVVPEPSTYIAGALLLLPFGASLVRRLRHRQIG